MQLVNGEYEAIVADAHYTPGREFTWTFQIGDSQRKKESRLTSDKAKSFLFAEIKKLGHEITDESQLFNLAQTLKGLKVKLNVFNDNLYIAKPVLSADIPVYADVPQGPQSDEVNSRQIALLERIAVALEGILNKSGN